MYLLERLSFSLAYGKKYVVVHPSLVYVLRGKGRYMNVMIVGITGTIPSSFLFFVNCYILYFILNNECENEHSGILIRQNLFRGIAIKNTGNVLAVLNICSMFICLIIYHKRIII